MVKMRFRVGPCGKIVTCVFTFNYFTIIIILKIAIGRVVLILKSIKMKLIIVNPYFLKNNSIYTVVCFAQILFLLLLFQKSYLFCRSQCGHSLNLEGVCCFDTYVLIKS